MSIKVPFYKPFLPPYHMVEKDFKQIYESGMLAPGKYTEKMTDKFKQYLKVKHVIAFSCCSDAMICLLAYIKDKTKRDIVIIPDFTFAATWQAVDWNKMQTIVVDTTNEGLIDTALVEKVIDKYKDKIAAILSVHLFGNPVNFKQLNKLASKYNIYTCFDSAHGLGTLIDGKPLGKSGFAEVFSIGTTKTLAAGEGGLLVTEDNELAAAMYKAAMHGHKYGELDVELKSLNGRIQEFNSVMACHGLDILEYNIDKRQVLSKVYNKAFPMQWDLSGINYELRPAIIPKTLILPSYKDYTLFLSIKDSKGTRLNPKQLRDKIVKYMNDKGVQTKTYYYPNICNLKIMSEMIKDKSVLTEFCSEKIGTELSNGCISIPFFTEMKLEEQLYVIDCIKETIQLLKSLNYNSL